MLAAWDLEKFFDGIEIVSVDVQDKPVSRFEQRITERRKQCKGRTLSTEEEHAESLLPVTRAEQLRFR